MGKLVRMSANDQMGQFGGHVRQSNGVPMHLQPSEVSQAHVWNRSPGGAGIPDGSNGDGPGMDSVMGGDCY